CSKFTSNLPSSALEVPLSFNFTDKISLSEQEATLSSKLKKAQFELARKEAIPDITLGVGVRNYQETNDKVFQVSTSIPLNI
ncbi:TolC family protein, partial [Acinetobacter baumannii]